MSKYKEFVEYILELLEPLGQIQTSRMFGGVLLKVHDIQLGVVFMDTVYFKVINEGLQKEWREAGSKQFTYTRKDKKMPVVIKNWWSVPERAMDNSEYMVELADEVLSQKENSNGSKTK